MIKLKNMNVFFYCICLLLWCQTTLVVNSKKNIPKNLRTNKELMLERKIKKQEKHRKKELLELQEKIKKEQQEKQLELEIMGEIEKNYEK